VFVGCRIGAKIKNSIERANRLPLLWPKGETWAKQPNAKYNRLQGSSSLKKGGEF